MLACPPHQSETSTTLRRFGSRHVSPSPPEHRMMGRIWSSPPPHAITRQRRRCQPRRGHPSSHVPIRAERSTLDSHALQLSRDETIGDRPNRPLRQRPLNREALGDRLALLAIPQRTTDHPGQPVERGEQDGEAGPEENDARVDDEPLHHEAHGTSASVTTTRKLVPGPHATRAVERARERDAVAESHFDLTFHVWHIGMLSTSVTPSHTTLIPRSSSVLPISSIFS